MAKPPALPDFESSLAELETIVATLEEGKGSLEQTLATYRRGCELLKHCQTLLGGAEEQIRVLDQDLEQTLAAALQRSGGTELGS